MTKCQHVTPIKNSNFVGVDVNGRTSKFVDAS